MQSLSSKPWIGKEDQGQKLATYFTVTSWSEIHLGNKNPNKTPNKPPKFYSNVVAHFQSELPCGFSEDRELHTV